MSKPRKRTPSASDAAASSSPATATTGPAPSCLSIRGGGISLQVSVVPNAKRTTADGLHDGALRVRLAALPIEGRANTELVDWLSGELGVPKRAVTVALGASSRRKRVDVDVDAERARAWLARVLASDAGD